jgi:Na+/melibiose symporter-like transporter
VGNPSLDKAPDDGDQESSEAQDDKWRSSYRDVMAIGEFRSMWLAHALSMVGTNLLNITASVLVYQLTQSAFAAGITLAVMFLPPILAGPLFSGLADILPRRQMMIVCDLLRAVGRGSRPKVRWKNDRRRKKRQREARKAPPEVPGVS